VSNIHYNRIPLAFRRHCWEPCIHVRNSDTCSRVPSRYMAKWRAQVGTPAGTGSFLSIFLRTHFSGSNFTLPSALDLRTLQTHPTTSPNRGRAKQWMDVYDLTFPFPSQICRVSIQSGVETPSLIHLRFSETEPSSPTLYVETSSNSGAWCFCSCTCRFIHVLRCGFELWAGWLFPLRPFLCTPCSYSLLLHHPFYPGIQPSFRALTH